MATHSLKLTRVSSTQVNVTIITHLAGGNVETTPIEIYDYAKNSIMPPSGQTVVLAALAAEGIQEPPE